MHSKISEVIHGSVLCLTLISLSGATVSKIFVNISLKLDQASLIFEAKKQLSHYYRGCEILVFLNEGEASHLLTCRS